jgi:hypothetical protein
VHHGQELEVEKEVWVSTPVSSSEVAVEALPDEESLSDDWFSLRTWRLLGIESSSVSNSSLQGVSGELL